MKDTEAKNAMNLNLFHYEIFSCSLTCGSLFLQVEKFGDEIIINFYGKSVNQSCCFTSSIKTINGEKILHMLNVYLKVRRKSTPSFTDNKSGYPETSTAII
ncbi:hypothetical protein LOAG_09216 [Loa loa]|uniref:Uncharacterized protein n=1 Tax=Loa loa TaxID=7209 RepID=A0A1S0TSV4_LOALO|nr:hypothetical protein LOAG_09216 [Loa loa]EFO19278.1 hypothetical protein LOAG_09216 [Loa loa]